MLIIYHANFIQLHSNPFLLVFAIFISNSKITRIIFYLILIDIIAENELINAYLNDFVIDAFS